MKRRMPLMVEAQSLFVDKMCARLGFDRKRCKSWVRRNENFAERLWLIDERLIFCDAMGYSEKEDTHSQRRMLDEILDSRKVPHENYLLVSDWKNLKGSSRGARKVWVENMSDDPRLLGLIFFNVSHFFKMNIKLGRRFNIVRFPVEIAPDADEAVQMASAVLGETPLTQTPRSPTLPPKIPSRSTSATDEAFLMEILAKIDWSEPGTDMFDSLPDDHHLKSLFEAFSTIKLEVDNVLKERQQREQELEDARNQAFKADKAKSAFLANMSHEIRTPMNGIMGCAGFLEESPLNEDQRDWVATIKDSTNHLLGIIDNILDITKIESGEVKIEKGPFSVSKVFSDVKRILGKKATEKGLELDYHLDALVPEVLLGDSGRLYQVMVNLAGNGIKFTEKGRVEMRAVLSKANDGQAQIRFEVHDTGSGIPEESVPFIFNSFYQADAGFSRKHEGTGLGLSICNNLAEVMGGELRLEKTSSEGTVFVFTASFDVAQREHSYKVIEKVSPPDLSDEEKSRVRILLVEDNLVNQKVAMKILSTLGYEATLAKDGVEAVEAVEGENFDLILMDLQMPRMSGFEATEKIRGGGEGISNPQVPIVAMTANAMKGDRERCLEAGMNDHLAKPVNPKILASTICTHLRGR